jgi:hypothetical protein
MQAGADDSDDVGARMPREEGKEKQREAKGPDLPIAELHDQEGVCNESSEAISAGDADVLVRVDGDGRFSIIACIVNVQTNTKMLLDGGIAGAGGCEGDDALLNELVVLGNDRFQHDIDAVGGVWGSGHDAANHVEAGATAAAVIECRRHENLEGPAIDNASYELQHVFIGIEFEVQGSLIVVALYIYDACS